MVKIKLDAKVINAKNPEIVITKPTEKQNGLTLKMHIVGIKLQETTICLPLCVKEKIVNQIYLDETQIRKIQPILTHWINTKNAIQNYEKAEAKK